MKTTLQQIFLFLGIFLLLIIGGCRPASNPALPESTPALQPTLSSNTPPAQNTGNDHYTIAEAEKLAGFDVREPTYLPKGVSFDFATYQESPSPSVTQHFKIVHEVYGDMGSFFQITQEPQTVTPPDAISCGKVVDGCEMLSIGDIPVVYHLNPAGPEGLDWNADGFSFHLLRTAGEPNKVYKEELISVVASMR